MNQNIVNTNSVVENNFVKKFFKYFPFSFIQAVSSVTRDVLKADPDKYSRDVITFHHCDVMTHSLREVIVVSAKPLLRQVGGQSHYSKHNKESEMAQKAITSLNGQQWLLCNGQCSVVD